MRATSRARRQPRPRSPTRSGPSPPGMVRIMVSKPTKRPRSEAASSGSEPESPTLVVAGELPGAREPQPQRQGRRMPTERARPKPTAAPAQPHANDTSMQQPAAPEGTGSHWGSSGWTGGQSTSWGSSSSWAGDQASNSWAGPSSAPQQISQTAQEGEGGQGNGWDTGRNWEATDQASAGPPEGGGSHHGGGSHQQVTSPQWGRGWWDATEQQQASQPAPESDFREQRAGCLAAGWGNSWIAAEQQQASHPLPEAELGEQGTNGLGWDRNWEATDQQQALQPPQEGEGSRQQAWQPAQQHGRWAQEGTRSRSREPARSKTWCTSQGQSWQGEDSGQEASSSSNSWRSSRARTRGDRNRWEWTYVRCYQCGVRSYWHGWCYNSGCRAICELIELREMLGRLGLLGNEEGEQKPAAEEGAEGQGDEEQEDQQEDEQEGEPAGAGTPDFSDV